jgi:uncharacterized protein
MKTNYSPLLVNVGFVAQQSIGYSREIQFECSFVELKPDFLVKNLLGEMILSRTSEGLLTRGVFSADIDLICGRCLTAITLKIKTEFTELIPFASHADEDSEIVYPEDGQINFAPIVGDYLILEIPINPLCTCDCKGLCPVCGNNLNIEECKHDQDTIDPRLKILEDLLDDE